MKPPVLEIPMTCEDEKLLPSYASEGAAGADIKANISEDLIIGAGEQKLVPTGVRVAIPEGYEIQIRPRSGLAFNHNISITNSPGTIDSDYRGEIKILLRNNGKSDFVVNPGMRIAQLVLTPVIKALFLVQEELTETIRGAGGFGHTGLS